MFGSMHRFFVNFPSSNSNLKLFPNPDDLQQHGRYELREEEKKF